MTALPDAYPIAARLDRLPLGCFHRRFLAAIALGAWFDSYDNFVAGSLAVILPAAGVLTATKAGQWLSPVGLFMAALPLGMFLGTLLFGLASDHLGAASASWPSCCCTRWRPSWAGPAITR